MQQKYKFNADILLPKEKQNNWFDNPWELPSIKNTQNVYRPFGVAVIPTTLLECIKYIIENKKIFATVCENYAMNLSENILDENNISIKYNNTYKFYCKQCNKKISEKKLLNHVEKNNSFECHDCYKLDINKKTKIVI